MMNPMTERKTTAEPCRSAPIGRVTIGAFGSRFRRVPVILQAYAVFAVVMTLVNFSVIFAPQFYRSISPYLGGLGMIYMFTFFFVFAAIATPQHKLLYAVVMLVGLGVLFGVVDLGRHLAMSAETLIAIKGNPYLAYAPLRPVVTIVVPLAWALLLVSPVMRKWINKASAEDCVKDQFQFSLADLLYVMMVVGMSTAVSVALVGAVSRKQSSLTTPVSTSQPGALS